MTLGAEVAWPPCPDSGRKDSLASARKPALIQGLDPPQMQAGFYQPFSELPPPFFRNLQTFFKKT